jgi:hypothetical protein
VSFHGVFVRAASAWRRSLSISFAFTKEVRDARMRATSVVCKARAPSLPIDLNNLCGCFFGTRIAYQHSMAQRSELPGRVYVTDSGIRSQVGWMVSPAAIPQGVQFRRLHSVRPVASAWLTGIHAMKTALSSNAIGPATTNIDSDQTLEDKVRQEILAACQRANWKLGGPRGAAARLGVKRTTLFYKMKRLGIAAPSDNWEN